MGLVGVHAITEAQIKPIAAEIHRKYKEAFLAYEQSLAQARVDLEALRQFESNLNALVPSGHAVPEANEIRVEIESRRKKLEAVAKAPPPRTLLENKARLFEKLPPSVVKTDADGRFTLKAKERIWLLAQSERTVGEKLETYFWADLADPASMQNSNALLLSNDRLIEEPDGVLDFLALVSGETLTPLAMPKIQVSPSLSQWNGASFEKIKPAIAAAKARAEDEIKAHAMAAEVARLRRIAEAKDTIEKRLAWTGAAMRRAGFKEDQIQRVLTQGGTMVAWGSNKNSQCDVPANLTGVVAIAAGSAHSLALEQDGTVVAWGSKTFGQSTVPSDLGGVVAIAAGQYHTVALKQDGRVIAWGSSSDDENNIPAGMNDVVAIAAGDTYTVALKQKGMLMEWGANTNGHHIAPASLSGVVAVAAGSWHNMALKQDGTLMVWGSNTFGQCAVPAGLSSVVAFSAGWLHTVVLKQNGTVMAWGDNREGQCAVPVGLSGVMAIAAGRSHTVALKQDGTVVAWGANDEGQCNVPTGLKGVVAIAAGEKHTLALKLD